MEKQYCVLNVHTRVWFAVLLCLCVLPFVSAYNADVVTDYIHRYSFNSTLADTNFTRNLSINAGASAEFDGVNFIEGNASFNFNGSRYVDNTSTTGLSSGNNAFSFSWWSRTSDYTRYVLGVGVFSTLNTMAFVTDNSATSANINTLAGDLTFTLPSRSAGGFYHNALVYHGNRSYFYYLNGTLVDVQTLGANMNLNQSLIRIGASHVATLGYIGQLDDVRIYNRNLSANEVTTIVQGVAGVNTVAFTLSNVVNGSAISGFCVSYSGNGTGANCSSTSTVNIQNVTGNLTFTIYNITSGFASPVYFNVTRAQFITGTTAIASTTAQSVLIVNVTQLYTNAQILSFNVTNQNVFNSTTNGTAYVFANNATNNLLVQVAGNYSANVSCGGLLLSSSACRVQGIYDAHLTVNATNITTPLSNFNITIVNASLSLNQENTTSGTNIVYNVLQGYSYFLAFEKLGVSTANTTLLVTNSTPNYNFIVYPAPAINITFYDEITDAPITSEAFTLEVINPSQAINMSITTNAYINLSGFVGVTIFRYFSDSYAQRDYIVDLDAGSIYDLRLYDINLTLSQVVTATVTDTGNAFIENSTVTLLRYFVGCNCYRTVQMAQTGADGSAIFYVQALDGHYKWSVSYQNTVYYLSTSSEQINSDVRNFVIDLGQNYYAGYEGLSTIGYAVTYNTTSQTLSYIYTDTQNIVDSGCLNVRYLSGIEYTTLQNACVNGTSGSVFVTLPSPNTTTYLYSALVYLNNDYTPILTLDTGSVERPSSYNFGNSGIFLAVGVIVVLVTIFSFSAVATVLISVLGVIIISAISIMTFTTAAITGMAVLVLGISLFLMRS